MTRHLIGHGIRDATLLEVAFAIITVFSLNTLISAITTRWWSLRENPGGQGFGLSNFTVPYLIGFLISLALLLLVVWLHERQLRAPEGDTPSDVLLSE